MSNNEACKTPVEDLLRSIPQGLVINYETDDNGFKIWHHCPIGLHAHEAVALIADLRCRLKLYDDAVKEAEAIFGCDYGDHYGRFMELVFAARQPPTPLPETAKRNEA
jgi:hypothetical protein